MSLKFTIMLVLCLSMVLGGKPKQNISKKNTFNILSPIGKHLRRGAGNVKDFF